MELSSTIAHYESPNYIEKINIHKSSKKFLKELALKVLGLAPGSFDIRSTKGGDGASGECALHGETIYIVICADFINSGHGVMYRYCNGRKDFGGGANQWTSLEKCQEDIKKFYEKIQK